MQTIILGIQGFVFSIQRELKENANYHIGYTGFCVQYSERIERKCKLSYFLAVYLGTTLRTTGKFCSIKGLEPQSQFAKIHHSLVNSGRGHARTIITSQTQREFAIARSGLSVLRTPTFKHGTQAFCGRDVSMHHDARFNVCSYGF